MGNYMKYEIKGTYKFILGILAIILIITTASYIYMANGGHLSVAVTTFIIAFGANLVSFLYIVGSFRKELYEDRGYLTFTLPLTGNQIIGAKLIVAVLWFFLLGIVIIGYTGLRAPLLSHSEAGFEVVFGKSALFMGIPMFINGVMALILAYFSMAISKVTFRNKKIGGLWFVIFLGLNILVYYTVFKVLKWMPYYLDLSTLKIVTYNIVEKYSEYSSFKYMSFGGGSVATSGGGKSFINIASIIYTMIVSIAAFLGTSYIVENKINL